MNTNSPNTAPIQPPTFCPRCRSATSGQDDKCEECGETRVPRGYCDICECWLIQAPGTACPKHDVPLSDSPARADHAGTSTKLVVVATYSKTSEAQGPKLRLEAEGIPAFLDGARMADIWLVQVATGGVRLMVPEEFASDSRILLSQSWAPAKLDDDHDPDDGWEGLAPPDAADRRRSVMKKMIVFYMAWPLIAIILVYLASKLIAMMG